MGKRSLAEDIAVEADAVVAKIQKAVNNSGGRHDPADDIVHAVANVISAVVFGHRFEEDDPEFRSIMAIISSNAFNMDIVVMRMLQTYGGFFKYLPSALMDASEAMRDVKAITDFTKKAIEARRAKLDPDNPACVLDLYVVERSKPDASPFIMSDDTLTSSILDLFGAGADTTANTLRWALKYLAQYPAVQEAAFEEIMAQVGRDAVPDHTRLGKMPYLSATIFEVMRARTLFPVGVEHCTIEDVTVGGYRLPKDTPVFVNQQAIHEDPRYWKDAKNFNVANFLDENGDLSVPQQFMPFGFGNRICLGQPLAKMELFVFLTRILQKMRVSFPEGEPVNMEAEGDVLQRPTKQDLIFTPRS